MFFSMNELSRNWNVYPTTILHVGAHEAEELEQYERLQCKKIYWVEAQPNKVNALKQRLNPNLHEVIEAAVWDQDGIELDLIVASNSESTSLLEFNTHKESYPEIGESQRFKIKTQTLESIIANDAKPDFVNLDIQGVELRALKGYEKRLSDVKWIYTEVNRKELYTGCALVSEIDEYLSGQGFVRVCTRWWKDHGWGDALYIRTEKINSVTLLQRLRQSKVRIFWNLKNDLRIFLRR
jgi:FkbM family methyltransferase